MHKPDSKTFDVVPVQAFAPMNAVQKRLHAMLGWWGSDMQNHRMEYGDYASGYGCAINAYHGCHGVSASQAFKEGDWAFLTAAASEMGFAGLVSCSDSGPDNARKMVLRAIELAA